ncbi:hypothetical protein N7465_004909 [Penicillium sp. CMV-2018d]|nr:hypothetical protein N7465_004909 [Penicillium sp. CMV-2018d]
MPLLMPLNSAWLAIEGCEWRTKRSGCLGSGAKIRTRTWTRTFGLSGHTDTDTETDIEAVKWTPKQLHV